jgi:outer membrane protein
MKKITLMAGLAALSAAPLAQAAPLVDVYAGGYAWSPDTSGSIASGSNDIDMEDDLGFDDSDQTVLYVGLEHAVPVLPNVRLRYMDLSDDASNRLNETITFNGEAFPVATTVVSEYDMEMLDGTFYWSPLDNVVKLDLGLTVRQMDADFTITGAGQRATESASETFPMAHGAVRANLPLTGVYVGGEINAIEYDGSGMRDFDAHIGWQSDFLLGVKAGYSRLEVELDDVSGLDSDLEIGGPYLAATFRF